MANRCFKLSVAQWLSSLPPCPQSLFTLILPISLNRTTIHAAAQTKMFDKNVLPLSLSLDQQVLSALPPDYVLSPSISLHLHCNPLRQTKPFISCLDKHNSFLFRLSTPCPNSITNPLLTPRVILCITNQTLYSPIPHPSY